MWFYCYRPLCYIFVSILVFSTLLSKSPRTPRLRCSIYTRTAPRIGEELGTPTYRATSHIVTSNIFAGFRVRLLLANLLLCFAKFTTSTIFLGLGGLQHTQQLKDNTNTIPPLLALSYPPSYITHKQASPPTPTRQ